MKSTLNRVVLEKGFRSAMALFALMFVAHSALAAPVIMSPDPVYDFGEMDNDQKVEHDFVVKNVGDETLEIADVKTTCGCTVAKLENKSLKPGEETVISATFNLKGKQGIQSKKITVSSNDPEQGNYYLEFKGLSTSTIMLEPALLNLGRIMDNEVHTQSVTIKSMKEGHSFTVTEVIVSESAPFTASLKEVRPGQEYLVIASTNPNLAAGTLSGRMTIMTDDANRAVHHVSVYGHVIGELNVRPDVITIRSSSAPNAAKATQYLQVLPGRAKDFELLDIIAPIEGMTAELIKRKDNDYHIKLSEMPVDNALKGKELIVTTNLPEKPEIRIPFKVLEATPIQVGRTPARVPQARPVAAPRPPVLPQAPKQ